MQLQTETNTEIQKFFKKHLESLTITKSLTEATETLDKTDKPTID